MTKKKETRNETVVEFYGKDTPSPQQVDFHNDTHLYTLIGGAKFGGKAGWVNSKVLTPFGFKRMGDMKVGDVVACPDGTYSPVAEVYPQGKKDLYKVTFEDGGSTIATLDHLWHCHFSGRMTKRKGRRLAHRGLYTTKELIQHLDNIEKSDFRIKPNIFIPLSNPIQFTIPETKNKKRLITPYILGVLIGDGSLVQRSIGFSSADEYIVNRIKEKYTVKKTTAKYGYSIPDGGKLRKNLKYYNLLHRAENKFVPEVYKLAPLNIRYEIIRGLFDTDGYIDKRGHVEFSTVSKKLSEDVKWLIQSIGGKCNINTKIGSYRDKNGKKIECQLVYRLTIRIKNPYLLFAIPRKRDRGFIESEIRQSENRKLISIKYWGKDDAQCIRIRHPEGLYITDDFIVTHNSKALCWEAFRLCWEYPGNYGFLGRKRGSDFKTSTLRTFFREIPGYLFEHKKQEHRILFENGSEIFYGGLDNRELIEKFNSMELGFFGIDQAEEISPDDWTALAGTLRFKLPTGENPQFRGMLSCNPRNCWLKDKFIIRPGEEYNFIQALPASNPSDGAAAYVETLKKLYENKPRLLRAYIDGSWDDLEATNTLIPARAINAAVDRDLVKPKTREKIVISCDPARFGDDETVIYVFRGLKIIDQMMYGNINTMETVGNIVVFIKKYEADLIVVDSVIHTGIVDRLMEMEYPVVAFNGAERATDPIKYKKGKLKMEMWDLVLDYFMAGKVSIPNDEQLKGQLGAISYQIISDETQQITPKKDLKATLGCSPDRAEGCAMGIWGWDTIRDEIDAEDEEPREDEELGRTGYG